MLIIPLYEKQFTKLVKIKSKVKNSIFKIIGL